MSIKFGKSKQKSTSQQTMNRTNTEGFQRDLDELKKKLGIGGFNSTQQQGVDALSAPNTFGAGLETQRNNLGLLVPQYQSYINAPTRQSAAIAPTTYAGATAGQAQAGQAATPDDVIARTGREFMDAYKNPYEQAVLDTTLDDLRREYDKSVNRSKMAAAAGGAYGGGRHGVFDAENADNYLRTVGSTSAGIRNLGFTNALGAGQTDATRFLGADQGNQQTQAGINTFNAGQLSDVSKFNAGQGTDVSKFNAGNLFTNDTNNANRLQQNNQFNVSSGITQDTAKLGALNDISTNFIAQAGLTSDQAALFRQNALDLIQAGAISVDQLMDLLRAQTATFGTTGTASGTGSQSGFSIGGGVGYDSSGSGAFRFS